MKKGPVSKIPPPATIAIYALGIMVGLCQVTIGIISLAPQISSDYYRESKIHYNAFAKNLTLLHDFIEKATLALYLRYLFAAAQTICGFLLVENGYFGGKYHLFGSYGLVIVNTLVLGLQTLAGFAFERIGPTLVFLVLIVTRHILIEQGSKKPKPGMKTRSDSRQKSSPKKNKHD